MTGGGVRPPRPNSRPRPRDDECNRDITPVREKSDKIWASSISKMAHLHRLSAVVSCWALLTSLCFGAKKGDTNLKSPYDSHRWFELHDALRKGRASPFYQGAVACAFNDARRCEKKFRDVFNSAPKSDQAVEAHRILASAYFTHGEYKKALTQVDAILALRPTDADALGGRPVSAVTLVTSDTNVTALD